MQTFHPAFNYKGHVALVHQSELYDVRTQLHGYHRLQTFGVILGMSQVAIYVEPTAGGVTTDTARTRLLINGQEPPWNDWAEEFKRAMPAALAEFIDSFDVGKAERDDNAAVRDKIKELLPLFNLPRYRRSEAGTQNLDEGAEAGAPPGGPASGDLGPLPPANPSGEPKPRPLLGRLKPGGPRGTLVTQKDIPEVVFLYGAEAAEIMNEDIAAHYVHAGLVQANGEFRVFRFLVDHFAKQYGDSPGVRKKITPVIEKWIKIVICDVVLGLRAMGSAVWTQTKIEENLRDDEALTMALVPRILLSQLLKREIYRDLGKPADETEAAVG
jgi:hypothetical protein